MNRSSIRRLLLLCPVVLLLTACGADHYYLDDFADDLVAVLEAGDNDALRGFFKYERDYEAFDAHLAELRAAGFTVDGYCEIDSVAETLAVHFVETGDPDDRARLELRLFFGVRGYYVQDSAVDW